MFSGKGMPVRLSSPISLSPTCLETSRNWMHLFVPGAIETPISTEKMKRKLRHHLVFHFFFFVEGIKEARQLGVTWPNRRHRTGWHGSYDDAAMEVPRLCDGSSLKIENFKNQSFSSLIICHHMFVLLHNTGWCRYNIDNIWTLSLRASVYDQCQFSIEIQKIQEFWNAGKDPGV